MGTVTELEAADLAGRIGIMYGDLTKGALAAKGAVYNPERDQKIVQLLEEKRPAALITVNRPRQSWPGFVTAKRPDLAPKDCHPPLSRSFLQRRRHKSRCPARAHRAVRPL
jgi:hypothetical protein